MKFLFLVSLLSQLLFSATSAQIEEYLSLSKADSELIAIEQVFDGMRSDEDNSSQEINQIYTLYLEEHLSSNELETLLELYRTPIMQRYIVEMDGVISKDEMNIFINSLEENPLTTERLDIIENILKHTVNDKQILSFYGSMTQRYRVKSKKGDEEKNATKEPTKQEQAFLDMMKKGARENLLYGTQVLSIEEMRELNSALNSSIISKASKVESDAMLHVMNVFIQSIASKPKKQIKENNQSL